jgi:hypothetical protein
MRRRFFAPGELPAKLRDRMPFPTQQPGPFTKESVLNLIPDQSGCYGIYRQGTLLGGPLWIYIGQGDIRGRLLDHLNGDIPCILNNGPTHYVTVRLNQSDLDIREIQLIGEYRPVCNKRVG